MAKEANDAKLVKAFEDHLKETENQGVRLKKVYELLNIRPGGQKCKVMKGLFEEGKGMIAKNVRPEIKDAGLIAKAQQVEHYEISGYSTAAHFAEMLGA